MVKVGPTTLFEVVIVSISVISLEVVTGVVFGIPFEVATWAFTFIFAVCFKMQWVLGDSFLCPYMILLRFDPYSLRKLLVVGTIITALGTSITLGLLLSSAIFKSTRYAPSDGFLPFSSRSFGVGSLRCLLDLSVMVATYWLLGSRCANR